MTRHDPGVTFRQMREYAGRVTSIVKERSRQDLAGDLAFFLAVTRALEIVGEAAHRLPPEIRARYPEIDWTGLIGLRNRLAHAYDLLDLDLLWKAIGEDMPILIEQLDTLLRDWPLPED
jgi:uncharacterized protein with HEPN domain